MPYAPEYLHMVFPGVTFEADLYGRNKSGCLGRLCRNDECDHTCDAH